MKKILIAILLLCYFNNAYAEWPNDQSLKVIVPMSPGNGLDILTRKFFTIFEKEIGQKIIIENKSGAGQLLGSAFVSKSKPDGYTLLVSSLSMITSSISSTNNSFDIEKDLIPIFPISKTNIFLIVNSKYKNESDFLFAMKQEKNVFYSIVGRGSVSHFSGYLYSKNNNLNAIPVSYKGTIESFGDLLTNTIQYTFAPSIIVENDKLKFIDTNYFSNWYGLYGPSGIPNEILNKIKNISEKIMLSNEFVEWLKNSKMEKLNVENFGNFYLNEIKRMKEINLNVQQEQ